MISAVEARIQRKNTEAFIRSNPERVALKRVDEVADGAGGRKRLPARTLRSQMMKFQESTVGNFSPLSAADEGRVQRSSYTLIALWDADLEPGDEFVLRGERYTVETVQVTDYEKKAVVARG